MNNEVSSKDIKETETTNWIETIKTRTTTGRFTKASRKKSIEKICTITQGAAL